MLEFDHQRSMHFVFTLKDERWFLESTHIDWEVKKFLTRNKVLGLLPERKEVASPPQACLVGIMRFLSQYRLDQSWEEDYSENKLEITITIKKRSQFGHSG